MKYPTGTNFLKENIVAEIHNLFFYYNIQCHGGLMSRF